MSHLTLPADLTQKSLQSVIFANFPFSGFAVLVLFLMAQSDTKTCLWGSRWRVTGNPLGLRNQSWGHICAHNIPELAPLYQLEEFWFISEGCGSVTGKREIKNLHLALKQQSTQKQDQTFTGLYHLC